MKKETILKLWNNWSNKTYKTIKEVEQNYNTGWLNEIEALHLINIKWLKENNQINQPNCNIEFIYIENEKKYYYYFDESKLKNSLRIYGYLDLNDEELKKAIQTHNFNIIKYNTLNDFKKKKYSKNGWLRKLNDLKRWELETISVGYNQNDCYILYIIETNTWYYWEYDGAHDFIDRNSCMLGTITC